MWLIWKQTKCLTYKNFLIKRRDKKQFLQELLYPIYLICIVAIIRAFIKPRHYPVIQHFPQFSMGNVTLQLNDSYSLLYAPNDNPNIIKLINHTNALLGLNNPPLGFANDSEIERYYTTGSNHQYVYAGVIFDSFSLSNISYTLRMADHLVPSTAELVLTGDNLASCRSELNNTNPSNDCPANRYLSSGFALLQNAIDTSITQIYTNLGEDLPQSKFLFQLMPKEPFIGGVSYVQTFVAIYCVMAYAPFVNFLLVGMVTEKEKKIKEGMMMMGLRTAAFWLSWFITYALTILLCTIFVTAIAMASSLYITSNPFLIFMIIFLYGLSIITFSFMLTPFFNKATVAAAVGSMSSIAFAGLYFLVTQLPTPPVAKWLMALLSPVALALTLSEATVLETTIGVQFTNLNVGKFPVGGGLLMLILDTFLYLLLAVYFDMVLPKEYGQQYHPLFFLFPSFWRQSKGSDSIDAAVNTQNGLNEDIEDTDLSTDFNGNGIRIAGITKTFIDRSSKERKEIKAVNNFNLDIYEGQITALLGHNGAGKTTLIAALTGLLPTTQGTAYIYNYDINKPEDMMKIREITGVCPQQDILFDTLTVREHLKVFATIKGIPNDQIDAEVDKTLDDILLTEKASTRATNLSGGQKRKLCVGIAIIGDPKVVYLDEPTSGMDPLSRRQIWSLLQSRRQGRVTLLTTHFMDEADILADRKAIISAGKLRCAGSSLFLKNRFGIGYHLGMIASPDSQISNITQLVKSYIPHASLCRHNAGELSYLLPLSDVFRFSDLFRQLESPDTNNEVKTRAQAYGITSYGISMTTLEEVFLKLREDNLNTDLTSLTNNSIQEDDQHSKLEANQFDFQLTRRLSTGALARQQTLSLLKIRLLNNCRDPLSIFFRFFFPPVFIILGLVFANSIASITEIQRHPPALKLTPELYLNSTKTISQQLYSNLILKNSTSGSISDLLAYVHQMGIYYRLSNLSDQYLLEDRPHTIGYDIIQFRNTSKGFSSYVNIKFNDTAVHSIPIAMNLIHRIRFKQAMYIHRGTVVHGDVLSISSKPFPKLTVSGQFNQGSFSSPLLIGLALNVIPAGFGIEVVRDRKHNIRQLLRASSVSSLVYWLSMFVSDFISFLCPVILMLIIIPIVNVPSLTIPAAMGALYLATITYMFSNIALAYAISFMFSSVETCQSVLPIFFNLAFLLPTICVSMLDMLTQPVYGLIFHYIFLILNPAYPIGGAVYYINQIYMKQIYLPRDQPIPAGSYFSFSSPVLYCILMPIVHIIALSYLLCYMDSKNASSTESYGLCRKLMQRYQQLPSSASSICEIASLNSNKASMSEDEDVREECHRITTSSSSQDVLRVQNLRREFIKYSNMDQRQPGLFHQESRKVASVEDLCFGVAPGEVFGLLGPNGAGKTTTLNLITGDMPATLGNISIAGYNLRNETTLALRNSGFCPQMDGLWERITLTEHLTTYAAIKGVPKECIQDVVNRFIDGMNIQEHTNKYSKNLSGGTKRKLSFGMSVIGCPRLLLMDEPSTGMDPGGKRFLWQVFPQLSSVIPLCNLTSIVIVDC
ncbi:ATP-binding cassette sub-family A member 5 [Trichoplax sp. H2]|nr:ATP-binding cassette sub-family A member 5 [Trichoplax sp. H2]|eukprot:RDD36392.1 ATP-binding cassette sub-family A member 5 [Trichoplax sp. H2]